MTAAEMRRARQKLDMSLEAFARELGYAGKIETSVRRIRRMENGSLRVSAVTAARVIEIVERRERLRLPV